MKRPFAAIGFTCFAIMLFLLFSAEIAVACYVFTVSAFFTVFILINKKTRQAATLLLCLCTVAGTCLLFICFNTGKQNIQSLTGENVTVEAVVAEAPYLNSQNKRHYCVLKLKSVNGIKGNGRLRLSFSPSKDGIDTDDLRTDNLLSFKAKVYVPGECEKSISRYFTGENIFLAAYSAKDITITKPSQRSPRYYFQIIRSYAAKKLRSGFSDSIAGLIVGMLTGDKSCLDSSLYEAFRKTGIAHLMAVSGLHLSVWVLSFDSILPQDGKKKHVGSFLLIFIILFIMLLAGMSESVKRAGFMCLILVLGRFSSRSSDSLNSLGLAVLLMILYNPGCVLSISMQLSVFSTLGIITLGKLYIKRTASFFHKLRFSTFVTCVLKSASDVFFISISVLIFTFPVLIYTFNGFSAVSAWINILIAPVTTPLLLISGFYVIASPFSFAAYPLALLIKALSRYIIFVTGLFSQFENSFITLKAENVLLFVASAVIISAISFAVLKKKKKGKLIVTVVAAVLAITVISANRVIPKDEIKIHLAAYGNNLALAIEKESNALLLEKMPSYENSLFTSLLDKKEIKLFAEAEDTEYSLFKNALDGKPVMEDLITLLPDITEVKSQNNMTVLDIAGKTLCIFSGEALQNADMYDIIINKNAFTVTVKNQIEGCSFENTQLFTLVLKQNSIKLRGENSWLNLMKNN